jgi:acetyl esterase/lipase
LYPARIENLLQNWSTQRQQVGTCWRCVLQEIIMRRARSCALAAGIILCAVSAAQVAQKPLVLDVWPDKVPGETKPIDAEKLVEPKPGQTKVQRLTNVSKPTITVHRPQADKNTGAAVVICPGGGYNILAWDLEGEEVAAWLNSIGVTGIILKYRVPRRPDQPKDQPPPGPLQDAQRALSLVRSKATEWGIDPKRIGILGFSAGGHLSAKASTSFDKRTYEPIDDFDSVSCRPDFAVLVYPAYLTNKEGSALSPSIQVTEQTPPMFLVHAGDDRILAENSVQLYLALRKAKVPAELHVYPKGGHGFGLRPSEHPVVTWPRRCEEWMRSQGLLKPAAK